MANGQEYQSGFADGPTVEEEIQLSQANYEDCCHLLSDEEYSIADCDDEDLDIDAETKKFRREYEEKRQKEMVQTGVQ